MNLNFRELDPVYLKIEIAKPFIEVIFILLFKSAEFVERAVYTTKKKRDLKSALIKLEL